MKVIATRLGVSPSSVHGWTADIEISDEHRARNLAHSRVAFGRRWSELNRERRRHAQLEGRKRARAGNPLHEAGCMLYWAEGAKDKNGVCLANSDVNLVAFFVKFLKSSFGLGADRLTVRLNVYTNNGLSLREIEDHWLSALELPRSSLRGHTLNHFPTSSSGRRPHLFYGVCQVRVLKSTGVVQHIFGAIQEYGGFDEPRWLDGQPRKSRRWKTADAASGQQ